MPLVRLADLLAGLSRLADLGLGVQSGESVRSAALAASLGRSLELDHDGVRAGLYTALLLHVGCVGYAHETSWLSSGRPRQFMEMWENRRCSILFHLLVPGGKWHTVIVRPVAAASAASSTFHRRVREPLEPPPSAQISSRSAVG